MNARLKGRFDAWPAKSRQSTNHPVGAIDVGPIRYRVGNDFPLQLRGRFRSVWFQIASPANECSAYDLCSEIDREETIAEKMPSPFRAMFNALRERNMAYESPPRDGFANLVPELMVSDIARSMDFWCRCLGFEIAYQRAESGFAYLQRPDGAQVMLCQRDGTWETGELEPPYGRGINLQILVEEVDPLIRALEKEGTPFYLAPREAWRRYGDREGGRQEFLIQDPDGYLLLFAKALGERPL